MNFPVSKTLIYCSLGTMASRYKNGASFVNAVIKSFCKNPQWHLIISLGGISKEKICLENLPLNVTIFDFAPQREILQYADLVLTHGGHGTIKECIEAGVPMIVFPCSYDQRGNAARVAYHRIGLRSLVLKKTFRQRIFNKGESYIASEDITLLIKEALSKQVYQENIKQIREKIKKADEMEEILHYMYSLLKRISDNCTENFSGIGIVVYDERVFDSNCHCDLRPNNKCKNYNIKDERIVNYLIDVSDYHNDLHDGFDMIDSKGNLTHVAQYFVPPIVKRFQPNLKHGVRLHSSICGSVLDGVICIGVISSGRDIYILRNGSYVNLEELEG